MSVLCRSFGLKDVETAEDIASETFLTASHTWGIEGLPPNPTAWLYTVARNKAANHFRRTQTFTRDVVPRYTAQQEQVSPVSGDSDPFTADVSTAFFEDSQLRLMFALCHPAIAVEVQVALCLRLLCGFGISEIADAFLVGKETITKRLLRGKERLREENVSLELPGPKELDARMDAVLTTIYLLFNEGYYASGGDGVLRRDLCLEAVRLCAMLIEYPPTNQPAVNALMALICFHFSRFDSRIGKEGEAVLYDDQDMTAWNPDWISRGGYFLQRAAGADTVSTFHVEAAIAYHHTAPGDEKWQRILSLYEDLLRLKPTPVVAMNRAYALYRVSGASAALAALEGVVLNDSHLYHALLGLLWSDRDLEQARYHFTQAIALARSASVKRALQTKLDGVPPTMSPFPEPIP